MAIKSPLKVRRQKPILHVHTWGQTLFCNPPQDERLVGSLLSILSEDDDPPGVENPVNIIMATMHIKRVLGQRPCTNLHKHCRSLSRRMVVLLGGVRQTLT